ncbi:DnaJ C-terminal domain-containing protein [Magnetococcales bacterium HHB-1]
MIAQDYYRTLQVSPDATQAQVRQAYRRLARLHHPDLNHSPFAEERFKKLGEAYETLGNPDKRAQYDQLYRERQHTTTVRPRSYKSHYRPTSPGPDYPLRQEQEEEPFNDIFGSNRFRFNRKQEQSNRFSSRRYKKEEVPEDIEVKLLLPLENAARGGVQEIRVTAPELGGTRTFQVDIPCGVRPGYRIRLANQGRRSPLGTQRGDLCLIVDYPDHPCFSLEGNDVHMTLKITPWEAALGEKVTLPSLDGQIKVKLPEGSSSGRKIRLRNKGFPKRISPHENGDMLVTLQIAIPERLTTAEKRLYRKLSSTSTFQPRLH